MTPIKEALEPSPAPVGDISKLIYRLEMLACEFNPKSGTAKALSEAAEALSRMSSALEPFAQEANRYDGTTQSDKAVLRYSATSRNCNLTVGDLRRARNLLAGKESGK